MSGSIASKSATSELSYTLVAAIDIGTSYSGYAYATRHELDKLCPNVSLNSLWRRADSDVATLKTPTVILLNEKKEFEAYGYEAERRYGELFRNKMHQKYYYFRKFKTKLFGHTNLKTSFLLKDESGKQLPALRVLSLCIRYLKGHLINALCMLGKDVPTEDIKWVIPVPGIWNDVTKQFMRTAAVQAGIPTENLKLALEPEAASIYCQYISPDKVSKKFAVNIKGSKFVVCGIGGGVTDMILQQKRKDGRLKEIGQGGGCVCGGTAVDSAFLQVLVRLFGADVIRHFFDEFKTEFLEMFKDFEMEKRRVTLRGLDTVDIRIRIGLENVCKIHHDGLGMEKILKKSIYKGKVRVIDRKLCIDSDISREFYRAVSNEIARQIKNVLAQEGAKDVTNLVLVGGLAESPVVHDIIKRELMIVETTSIKRIIVPPEPSFTVLRGAVMFGHLPKPITSRVLRYTYGMRKAKLFNPDIHSPDRKVMLKGAEYVFDVFSPFVTIGTRSPVGFTAYDTLTTLEPHQKTVEVAIYYSTMLQPNFVDDDNVWLLGKVKYFVPSPSEEERSIYIEMVFGETELVMTITDRKTQSRMKTSFPQIEM